MLKRMSFKKGIYNGKQIVIYEFKSIDDLRLTIAHEVRTCTWFKT